MSVDWTPQAPLTNGHDAASEPAATLLVATPRRRRWFARAGRTRVLVGRGARAELLRAALAPDGTRLPFFDVDVLDGQLADRLERATPDDVYFDLGAALDEHLLARLGARLLMHGTAVHFVFPQPGRPPVRAVTRRLGTETVVSLHAVAGGRAAGVVRRVVDVVGAAALTVVLAPLGAAIALAVWARMGLPVLHRQVRLGRGGRRFVLYKFRSMVPDAEARLRGTPDAYARYRANGFKVALECDDRVTPLGRLLRRTSLDELPQLWNVLRGDMSLVGPRAIVPEELAEYGDYGQMLLRVKPGLTGVWQVSGRSTVAYPERAHMDLRYVEGRTLVQDLQILARTLPAVIRQRGAL